MSDLILIKFALKNRSKCKEKNCWSAFWSTTLYSTFHQINIRLFDVLTTS
uniref:AlNc14C345G10847 protein n=1 Tax=Albugo laibachii Nc14 TaxID=890382 RepID=F0WX92_9STRA|nr:AlNc14C345G10847 [Albugo laibachii Nc14]|eukprot:CCA26084.1 AlNc14C345G10847 [Albugo laibachii Nc14]